VQLQMGEPWSLPARLDWKEVESPATGRVSLVNQLESTMPASQDDLLMHKMAEWGWTEPTTIWGEDRNQTESGRVCKLELDRTMKKSSSLPQSDIDCEWSSEATSQGRGLSSEEFCSNSTAASTIASAGNVSSLSECTAKLDRCRLIEQLCITLEVDRDRFEDADAEALLDLVPTGTKGELLSVGSLLHNMESRTCRPCVFWFQNLCNKDFYCTYCHIVHDGQKKKKIRASKSTRRRVRQQAKLTDEGGYIFNLSL